MGAQQLAGSLWQKAPPPQDAAQLINLDALDALFAQPVAARPAPPGGGAAAAGEGGGWGVSWDPAALERQSSDGSVHSVQSMGSGLGRTRSGAGLAAAARRPAVRFITSGRKSVNIEILLRKLGTPQQVGRGQQHALHWVACGWPGCFAAPVRGGRAYTVA